MKILIRTIINIQFLFLLLTVNYCKPPELKILSIELCENFSSEGEILHKTYKANYSFYGSSGHVEGLDIGEDWIGSFQYLGSIIKDRQRLFKEEKNYPKIELLFPANLKFTFESELAKGDITTELNVNLQYKE